MITEFEAGVDIYLSTFTNNVAQSGCIKTEIRRSTANQYFANQFYEKDILIFHAHLFSVYSNQGTVNFVSYL